MPQGLQVWDASGSIIFDTSTRTGRVIGKITLASGASGVFNVAERTGSEVVWAILTVNNSDIPCTLSVSGSNITYNLGATAGYIVYGVY